MFQEEPRPVPAAVWVLLGKLAVACKLGTLSHTTRSPPLISPLYTQPLEIDLALTSRSYTHDPNQGCVLSSLRRDEAVSHAA